MLSRSTAPHCSSCLSFFFTDLPTSLVIISNFLWVHRCQIWRRQCKLSLDRFFGATELFWLSKSQNQVPMQEIVSTGPPTWHHDGHAPVLHSLQLKQLFF